MVELPEKTYIEAYIKIWKTCAIWISWKGTARGRKSLGLLEVLKKTADKKNDRSGLITRRSEVRILPPLLGQRDKTLVQQHQGFFFFFLRAYNFRKVGGRNRWRSTVRLEELPRCKDLEIELQRVSG